MIKPFCKVQSRKSSMRNSRSASFGRKYPISRSRSAQGRNFCESAKDQSRESREIALDRHKSPQFPKFSRVVQAVCRGSLQTCSTFDPRHSKKYQVFLDSGVRREFSRAQRPSHNVLGVNNPREDHQICASLRRLLGDCEQAQQVSVLSAYAKKMLHRQVGGDLRPRDNEALYG